MVDPWTLRILVEVADRGSLSAAAEALVLSQPAVSRQIANLERHLRVPLFRRVPRGVVATPAGATAVDLARSILARHEAFEATMKTFVGMAAGPLRLAGFASVNTWFLPEAIRRFRTAHPDVTVMLQQIGPLEVLDAVRRGDIDVALLTDWQLVASPLTAVPTRIRFESTQTASTTSNSSLSSTRSCTSRCPRAPVGSTARGAPLRAAL